MALTAAERVERHRQARKAEVEGYRDKVREMLHALEQACTRSGKSALCKGLPDDPQEALVELTKRLETAELMEVSNRKRITITARQRRAKLLARAARTPRARVTQEDGWHVIRLPLEDLVELPENPMDAGDARARA